MPEKPAKIVYLRLKLQINLTKYPFIHYLKVFLASFSKSLVLNLFLEGWFATGSKTNELATDTSL